MNRNRRLFLSGFGDDVSLKMHCVSRVVDRNFVLGDEEREMFNRDPIKEDGGLNVYNFCDGDPINYVDVLGLNKKKFDVDKAIKKAEELALNKKKRVGRKSGPKDSNGNHTIAVDSKGIELSEEKTTDCITNTTRVLKGGGCKLTTSSRRSGNSLVKLLYNQGWKGIFIMPDINEVRGYDVKRAPYRAGEIQTIGATKKYPLGGKDKVPLTGAITNFAPYDRDDRDEDIKELEEGWKVWEKHFFEEKIKHIKFGVYVASYETHVAYIIDGKMCDVHYTKTATNEIYTMNQELFKWFTLVSNSDSRTWSSRSGIIMVPSSSMVSKSMKEDLKNIPKVTPPHYDKNGDKIEP